MDLNSELITSLKTEIPNGVLAVDSQTDIFTVTLESSHLIQVMSYLKTTAGFSFLTDLCGIHYPDLLSLGVVYHLHDLKNNRRIRLKTFVNQDNPVIDSVTAIFPAANWMERETYDFFGIQFNHHPELRRILNEEDMSYFPMRKEYPLEDASRTDKQDEMFGR